MLVFFLFRERDSESEMMASSGEIIQVVMELVFGVRCNALWMRGN